MATANAVALNRIGYVIPNPNPKASYSAILFYANGSRCFVVNKISVSLDFARIGFDENKRSI